MLSYWANEVASLAYFASSEAVVAYSITIIPAVSLLPFHLYI